MKLPRQKPPIEALTKWVIAKKIVRGNLPPEEIAKKIQSKLL